VSKWKNKDGKTVRRNQIATQFAWQSIEMLESPAYRALSLSGHRIWARIQIEHANHGGKENGKLPVTYRDFNEFGVCWDAIGPGIREVEALGFVRVTEEGRAGNGEWRKPNKFALTHLPTVANPKPTEDWKRIKTVEEALAIAAAARKTVQKKQNTSRIKHHPPSRIKRSESQDYQSDKMDHCPVRENGSLSISRVDTHPSSGLGSALSWFIPIPNINPCDEADSPAWVAAWLEQIPDPTVSLSEIREAMGYRQ